MNRKPGARRSPRGGRPRRRVRRRSRSWLVAVPLVALALWLIAVNYILVIRNVEVTGGGAVSAAEVVRLSGIRLGGRMSRLDEAQIRQNVESDGRLAFMGVSRRYPSTVRIAVRERTHDALILQAGKVLILDTEGYVAEVIDRLPAESMPYVTGLRPSTYQLGRRLDAADGRLNAMRAALEALKAQGGLEYVSELNVENTADLRITTRTGMTVLLGDAENMERKVAWMLGALRDLEARGETLGRLDVASGSKADFLPAATPTPSPTPSPTPDPYGLEGEEFPADGAI